MWFWPINVKAWWLFEDLLFRASGKVREVRINAQLNELTRLELSLAELSV